MMRAVPIDVTQQAEALARGKRTAEAVRLLISAGDRGAEDALFLLAMWHFTGEHVGRDLAAARHWFGRAAEAGSDAAAAIHVAFVAGGTGGPADWRGAVALLGSLAVRDEAARDQLRVIGAMTLTRDGAPASVPTVTQLAAQPAIGEIKGLLSPDECAFLARSAEAWLEPAVVVDPRSGRLIADPVRRADTAAFTLATANPAIHALNRRIAVATNTVVAQGEPLQILSYRIGQEYQLHHDAIAGMPNQRVLTILIALNDDYQGGVTRFPDARLDWRGRTGDAIVFRNSDAQGRPDPRARHAGTPVTTGRKLLASRWIRRDVLDLGDKRAATG